MCVAGRQSAAKRASHDSVLLSGCGACWGALADGSTSIRSRLGFRVGAVATKVGQDLDTRSNFPSPGSLALATLSHGGERVGTCLKTLLAFLTVGENPTYSPVPTAGKGLMCSSLSIVGENQVPCPYRGGKTKLVLPVVERNLACSLLPIARVLSLSPWWEETSLALLSRLQKEPLPIPLSPPWERGRG